MKQQAEVVGKEVESPCEAASPKETSNMVTNITKYYECAECQMTFLRLGHLYNHVRVTKHMCVKCRECNRYLCDARAVSWSVGIPPLLSTIPQTKMSWHQLLFFGCSQVLASYIKNGLIARFIWLKNGLTCPQFQQGLTRFPQ